MPDPIAAFVRAQMRFLRVQRAKRQRYLEIYEGHLGKMMMTQPGEASGHLAVMRCENEGHAKLVRRRLEMLKTEWSLHYRVPEEYRRAHELTRRLVTIPIHCEITSAQVAAIARAVATV
jgi:dTDP-4-amino-4,6-dideoxygalactose transaminase